MDKIILYTNSTCGYCSAVKEELKNINLDFEERPTLEYAEEWQDVVNITGVATVPTINFDDEYFLPGRDFQNAKQIVERLQSSKVVKTDKLQRTFERVKTLSYNINMAFGKLDQLLRQIETKINTDEHKSTD